MADPLVCWKCGRSLDDLPQPLGRYDICPGCRAELYVCRMCDFFDPRISSGCQEPMAEEIKEKERANFCNYFQARPNAFQASDDTPNQTARAALDALFGGGESTSTTTTTAPATATDDAQAKLAQLFGQNDKDQN